MVNPLRRKRRRPSTLAKGFRLLGNARPFLERTPTHHLTNQAITLSSVRSSASNARERRLRFMLAPRNKGIEQGFLQSTARPVVLGDAPARPPETVHFLGRGQLRKGG